MPNDLANFIAMKQAEAQKQPSIDWAKRRTKWLQELNLVFDNVITLLTDAGLSKTAIKKGEREIVEEKLGQYTAPTLSVTMPDGLIIDFDPVGSVIIGGFGRVDVSARNSTSKRLLIAGDADSDADADVGDGQPKPRVPSYERKWQWEFLAPGRPSAAAPISATSLMDVLVDLSNAPTRR